MKDAYVAGAFDLRDLRKRSANLEGELSVLRGLLNREDGPIAVDDDAVHAVAHVFASWENLRRDRKRALLRDFGIRVAVQSPRRRALVVTRIEVESLAGLRLYKKMKRLGIE